jgi:hypothetical protein
MFFFFLSFFFYKIGNRRWNRSYGVMGSGGSSGREKVTEEEGRRMNMV